MKNNLEKIENKIKSNLKKKPKKAYKKASSSTVTLPKPKQAKKVPIKGKPTKNQTEWLKNQKRIMRFIKGAKNRGYHFDVAAIAELTKMPTIITKKRLESIKNLKPRNLYKYAVYETPEGNIVSGTQGRKMELAEAARKRKINNAKKLMEERIQDDIATHFWTEVYKKGGVDFKTWLRQTPYKVVRIKDEYRNLYYTWLHKMEDDDTYKQSFQKFLEEHFEMERAAATAAPSAPSASAAPSAPSASAAPSATLPNDLDMAYDMLRSNIETLSSRIGNRVAWNVFITELDKWFRDNIEKHGKIAVARMLIQAYSFGFNFTTKEVYEGDAFNSSTQELLQYMGANSVTQSYGDMIDTYEDI